MLKYICLIMIGLLMSCSDNGPNYDMNNPLHQILKNSPAAVQKIMNNAGKHRVQILYTQIDRDENNQPTFTAYGFGLNKTHYFYPASTVKLPAAILAMEKLNRLGMENVNIHTYLQIDSARASQSAVLDDPSSQDGKPSIGHYIKKIFLVSDNDAYNRLYEFLGQQYFNEALWEKGYKDAQMVRRLESRGTPDDQRFTNPFLFYGGENIFYEQPLVENPNHYKVEMADVKQGIGYMRGGKLVNEPIDFSNSNYISLESLQGILRAVILPEGTPAEQRFDLSDEDYQFLYKYMSMLPRESDYPSYPDSARYYDSYVKFFMFGDSKAPLPNNIRIFNKVGNAYGYLIDNAYIVDVENKIEFFLSAVIQVNDNQIYNDDTYEYKTLGYPFFAKLGQAVYDYERQRKRAFSPDLQKFISEK